MPSVKISQLPEVTSTTGTERFLVVQGGVSKQIYLDKLFNGVISDQSFSFNIKANDFKVTNDYSGTSYDVLTIKGGSTNNVGVFNNNPLQKLHVGGSIQAGISAAFSAVTSSVPSSVPAIVITPYELIRNSGTPSLSTDTTLISIDTPTTYHLGVGTDGQTKTFIIYDLSGTGSVTIDTTLSSSRLGFTSISLSALGSSVTLKCVNGKWMVIAMTSNVNINA